jgi:hypothetical protein
MLAIPPSQAEIDAQLKAVRLPPDMTLEWEYITCNDPSCEERALNLQFALRAKVPDQGDVLERFDLDHAVPLVHLQNSNAWRELLKIEIKMQALAIQKNVFDRWFRCEPIILLRAV